MTMKKMVGYDKGLADNLQDLLNAVVIQAAEDLSCCFGKTDAGSREQKMEKTFEETMLEISEEERKLENKYLRLAELKKKNEELICSLRNSRYRRVLRMHYIDGLTWQAIAERLNVTERHAYYLNKKAQDELLNFMGLNFRLLSCILQGVIRMTVSSKLNIL